MLTYPWKCTVLHCNHLGNTWKPLVLITGHFDYCPSVNEGDNQSVRSSAPVVSRCFPGGYNVKLYISRGRLAWWLLAFLHSALINQGPCNTIYSFMSFPLYQHWHIWRMCPLFCVGVCFSLLGAIKESLSVTKDFKADKAEKQKQRREAERGRETDK